MKAALHDGDALAELIERGTEALVGHVRVKPEDLAGPAGEEPTTSDRVRGLEVSVVGLMTLLGRRIHGVDPYNIAEVSCSAWLAQQVEHNPAALNFLEHGWGYTDDAGQVHRYVATVQRVEGQTPGEMITALKTKVLDQDQRIARLQAVLDAETGRKGLPGWKYDGHGEWVFMGEGRATAATHRNGIGYYVGEEYGESTDALDGMERATAALVRLGFTVPTESDTP